MAALQFGTANSNDGFTTHSTASFNDLPPARIVRELIQNSLDAAVEAGEPAAYVTFRVDAVRRGDVPDLQGYTRAFQKAVTYQTGRNDGELPDPAHEVVNRIRGGLNDIKAGNARMLSVTDNGVGLDIKRMNSLLSDGASAKAASASGSYGVGHLAPMALSDIRYVLYGGMTADGNRIAGGKAVLAPHPGKERLNDGKGYLIKGFKDGRDGNLYDFLNATQQPRPVKKILDAIGNEWGHGCVVVIPAYNSFRDDGIPLWDIVSKVAAYNFAPAIHHGKLILQVQEDDNHHRLDASALRDILDREKISVRAARSNSFFAGLRPSGQNAYSILQALADGESHQVAAAGGEAQINFLTPSLSGYPRIDLFRNGMWIAESIPGLGPADFASRQPFHAVIQVDATNGGELHRLVRKAEGAMHDSLYLSLLSKPEQATLKQAFAKIAERIKEIAPEGDADEYTVDDFLMVNTRSEGAGGQESFSFWGTPATVSRRSSAQVRPVPDDVDNDDKDREVTHEERENRRRRKKSQQRPLRPLPFRSAVVPDGNGKLVGSVTSAADFAETWLTIRVDENSDFTCDRIGPDEDVPVKSFRIAPADGKGPALASEITDNGRFVKIRGIAADTEYEVRVEYDASQELAAVVALPVLRLELHRPPGPRKQQKTNSQTEKEGDTDGADGN